MGTEKDCERALFFVMHVETNTFNNLIHQTRKKQHEYQQGNIQTHTIWWQDNRPTFQKKTIFYFVYFVFYSKIGASMLSNLMYTKMHHGIL